jgi:hypothetical protein
MWDVWARADCSANKEPVMIKSLLILQISAKLGGIDRVLKPVVKFNREKATPDYIGAGCET